MAIRIRAAAAASITTTGDWTDTPTYGVIRIGTHVLDSAQISPALTETPEDGDVLRIVDEGAPFDLTLTGAGEAALNAIISAALAISPVPATIAATVSLHDGDPGTNGDDNEIDAANNPGYARIALTLESVVV